MSNPRLDKIVAVFVCNEKYIGSFYCCCEELITRGNFNGDIVLLIGNDWTTKEMYQNESSCQIS